MCCQHSDTESWTHFVAVSRVSSVGFLIIVREMVCSDVPPCGQLVPM